MEQKKREKKERVLALISVPSVYALHITISIFHFSKISILLLVRWGKERGELPI